MSDYSNVFRLINLVVGALMAAGGIFHMFPISIPNVVIGAYVAIFGAEFQIPAPISRYASFLFSFIGRGAFYIFAGSILLENHVINIIFGTIIGIIGICYVILEFIPPIEAPINMKEVETV
ncbi:Golgi apparatus membrane protein tvp15 [Golovinomyces cichoracearum]|uniref:Golgi apparatus membrane protein tvp15 n=1 Tax=Golovinomyces cichoracearum TaxID=62708 RepID=A0A420IVT0_9PEZI|nr:Golgi apparatus membrane protein tvp15 [Golovinomyces cichoracearum]